MEDLLTTAFQSGNAEAILYSIIVYLIIHYQRKNTGEARDKQLKILNDNLKKEVAALQTEKELMKQDINYLKDENSIVKSDIKEIKETLQQISLSLAKIAARSELSEQKGK